MTNLDDVNTVKSLMDLVFSKYGMEIMDDRTYASLRGFLAEYLEYHPSIYNKKKVLMLLPVFDCNNNAVEIVAVTHNDSHLVGQIRRTVNYNEQL